MLYNVRPDMLSLREMSPSNGVTYFSAVFSWWYTGHCYRYLIHPVKSSGRCDCMIMEYTHDEYCNMLLNPCTYSGIAAWEYALRYTGKCHPDADVFWQPEQCLCEKGRCNTYYTSQ
jgi:hypothetical protein